MRLGHRIALVLVLGTLVAPAQAADEAQVVLPDFGAATWQEAIAPVLAQFGHTLADVQPVPTQTVVALQPTLDPRHGGVPAACVSAAPQGGFVFGYLASPPDPACPYMTHAEGNIAAVMVCAAAPGSFCQAFAYFFDWSTFSFGYWFMSCAGPGAVAANWAVNVAQATPGCSVFSFGPAATSWVDWQAYQYVVGTGAVATIAAH